MEQSIGVPLAKFSTLIYQCYMDKLILSEDINLRLRCEQSVKETSIRSFNHDLVLGSINTYGTPTLSG